MQVHILYFPPKSLLPLCLLLYLLVFKYWVNFYGKSVGGSAEKEGKGGGLGESEKGKRKWPILLSLSVCPTGRTRKGAGEKKVLSSSFFFPPWLSSSLTLFFSLGRAKCDLPSLSLFFSPSSSFVWTHPSTIHREDGWAEAEGRKKEEGQSKVLIFRSPPSSSSRLLGRGFLGTLRREFTLPLSPLPSPLPLPIPIGNCSTFHGGRGFASRLP